VFARVEDTGCGPRSSCFGFRRVQGVRVYRVKEELDVRNGVVALHLLVQVRVEGDLRGGVTVK